MRTVSGATQPDENPDGLIVPIFGVLPRSRLGFVPERHRLRRYPTIGRGNASTRIGHTESTFRGPVDAHRTSPKSIACLLFTVALGWLLLTPPAQADQPRAQDARLIGKFKILGSGGERRTWSFTPGCGRTGCQKVYLLRGGPRGSHFHSVLHRTGPGRYKATEESRLQCRGTTKQTAKIRLRITEVARQQAVEIRGRVKFTFEGCGINSERVRVRGYRE